MAISPEYLAGFFDGEGYVYVYMGKRQMTVYIGIANTHFAVLQMLQEQFGGTLHSKRRRKTEHSQGWELRWTSRNAKRVLATMLPHLVVKRAEVAYILSAWFPLVRKTGRGHGWTTEEKNIRRMVVSEFHAIRASERKVHQHELVN